MKVEKRRINADLTIPMYDKIKAISVECGLTMSAIITYALMQFLDQREAFNMVDIYKKAEKEKLLSENQK